MRLKSLGHPADGAYTTVELLRHHFSPYFYTCPMKDHSRTIDFQPTRPSNQLQTKRKRPTRSVSKAPRDHAALWHEEPDLLYDRREGAEVRLASFHIKKWREQPEIAGEIAPRRTRTATKGHEMPIRCSRFSHEELGAPKGWLLSGGRRWAGSRASLRGAGAAPGAALHHAGAPRPAQPHLQSPQHLADLPYSASGS